MSNQKTNVDHYLSRAKPPNYIEEIGVVVNSEACSRNRYGYVCYVSGKCVRYRCGWCTNLCVALLSKVFVVTLLTVETDS